MRSTYEKPEQNTSNSGISPMSGLTAPVLIQMVYEKNALIEKLTSCLSDRYATVRILQAEIHNLREAVVQLESTLAAWLPTTQLELPL